jgi:hypothetical protein
MPEASTGDNIQCTPGEIHACDAYIDTIEAFFSRIRPAETLRRLKQVSAKALLTQCRKNGLVWGYRLTVHQPSLSVLQKLDTLAIELEGILSRLDTALNYPKQILPKPKVLKHVTLKWRRAGVMLDIRDTSYWNGFQEGKRPSPRDLVCYDDKPNKVTGELNSTHIELKLRRARVLKANGINNIQDVINLNPFNLFMKHIKWNEWNDEFDDFVQKMVRRTVRDDCKKYRGRKSSAFTDRYRSRIPHRVTELLLKLKSDRAQIMRDLHPKRLVKSLSNPLSIPTSLTFPK